ncbi:hypothetical protein OG21DRAFT_1524079 [Imleria badia]|nr:hypothetical protein OG21DRAFT_1524079 [Imleria badia]
MYPSQRCQSGAPTPVNTGQVNDLPSATQTNANPYQQIPATNLSQMPPFNRADHFDDPFIVNTPSTPIERQFRDQNSEWTHLTVFMPPWAVIPSHKMKILDLMLIWLTCVHLAFGAPAMLDVVDSPLGLHSSASKNASSVRQLRERMNTQDQNIEDLKDVNRALTSCVQVLKETLEELKTQSALAKPKKTGLK